MSTGPRTLEGRARAGAAAAREWAKHRALVGLPPWWRSTANQVSRQKRERLGLTAASYIARFGRWDGRPREEFEAPRDSEQT